MSTRPDADRPGRVALSEQHLIITELFDRYIQRRQHGDQPHAYDLLAAAAEHGDTATDVLLVLVPATRQREPTTTPLADDPTRPRRCTPPRGVD
jgi:hypothetical protein